MKFDFIPDSVSHFDNAYDVLKERGFIEQSTNEDEIRKLLQNEKVKFYIGFDPTADCLHVGHFMQVIIMMYMQKYGHTPVVLIGGGTGMVGDPSGRTDMRKVMTIETIENNCNQFKKLFDRFLDFDDEWEYVGNEGVYTPGHQNKEPEAGKAVAVNNARWLRPLNYIDFLREIGTQFNINTMLRAECFKQRMEREGGLTMFELNYMLMQSYDFMVMARDFDVKIEFGGNDQWSNMLGGTELIRRKLGKDAHAMTITLLLNSEGKKMGKTAKGAVWLDPNKTSPFEFYQYWRNVDDADVLKCIRMLTFLPLEEIDKMDGWQGEQLNKAKEILAYELTKMVHGEAEADKAQAAAKAVFAGSGEGVPTVEITAEDGADILSLLVKSGLCASKSDARRNVQQGGVAANDEKVTDIAKTFTDAELKAGVVLKRGKKNFRKVLLK